MADKRKEFERNVGLELRRQGERVATINALALLIAKITEQDQGFPEEFKKSFDKVLGAIGPALKDKHGELSEAILMAAREHISKIVEVADARTQERPLARPKSFWERLFG